jgi:hypothetical protein
VRSASLPWYVSLLRCHRLCRMLDDPLTRHRRYLLGNHRTCIKSCTSQNIMLRCFICHQRVSLIRQLRCSFPPEFVYKPNFINRTLRHINSNKQRRTKAARFIIARGTSQDVNFCARWMKYLEDPKQRSHVFKNTGSLVVCYIIF